MLVSDLPKLQVRGHADRQGRSARPIRRERHVGALGHDPRRLDEARVGPDRSEEHQARADQPPGTPRPPAERQHEAGHRQGDDDVEVKHVGHPEGHVKPDGEQQRELRHGDGRQERAAAKARLTPPPSAHDTPAAAQQASTSADTQISR